MRDGLPADLFHWRLSLHALLSLPAWLRVGLRFETWNAARCVAALGFVVAAEFEACLDFDSRVALADRLDLTDG